ncbi:AraC family transcriptional regulator [Rhodococcus sp. IEGM 1251]|uniref:AraC family transcriptional regulator n=1 Tax=Rhodococcus sp. IEGM 1237 TaxID=3047095 RepID=UPI0024B78C12|nr:AraC family transcriptional regulator [Rhodococcus sp. IEGM 1237]MDI9965985.1 AraC family transcriptional regulator [Rhodococcus sp. IEGM 1251]
MHRCVHGENFTVEVPTGVRALHIAEHGDIVIRTQGKAPIELGPGELVLLPHGLAHTIENAMPMHTKNETCWLFGTFTLDDVAALRLLSVLPDFVELRATQGTPVEWLEVSSRLLGAEVDDPKPGSSVMVSRILDLLFVQILRAWARADGSNGGWLTAAMDPRIGQALEAVHNDPSRNWTIDELATLSTLSRSSFAERFSRLVGQTPGAYITERRLDRAAELLVQTTEPVGTIAITVGYESDAAFSRAFRRRFDASPLNWRKSNSHNH